MQRIRLVNVATRIVVVERQPCRRTTNDVDANRRPPMCGANDAGGRPHHRQDGLLDGPMLTTHQARAFVVEDRRPQQMNGAERERGDGVFGLALRFEVEIP